MIAEINVVPVGEGAQLTPIVARVVELVASSDVEYEVHAFGTVLRGGPDTVWPLVRGCHELALAHSDRVMTQIRIDDGRGRDTEIGEAAEKVEQEIAGNDG